MKISKISFAFLLGLAVFAVLNLAGVTQYAFLKVGLFVVEIGAILALAQDWWRKQDDVTSRHWRR